MKVMNALIPTFLLLVLACNQRKTPLPKKLSLAPLPTPNEASFRGIASYEAEEVWITGTQGTILHSQDSGKHWQVIDIPGTDTLDFRDVEVLDKNTVLLMSIGPGTASRIYKTTDGGKNWRMTYQNQEEKAFFDGIDFWDATSGMLISDPIDGRLLLLKTEDAGESWERVGEQTLSPLLEMEYGFAASGTGIVTIDQHKVWIATGGETARIFYSPDRGANWREIVTPVISGNASSGIFSIAFRDALHGVAVGGDYQNPQTDYGNIAITRDGGQTWKLIQNDPPIFHKACVQHLGAQNYLAVGRTGMALSRDDGEHWEILNEESYYCLAFDLKSGVGYVAGTGGRAARVEWK